MVVIGAREEPEMHAQTRGSLVSEDTGSTLEAAPRAGGAGTTSDGQVNPAGVSRREFAIRRQQQILIGKMIVFESH